MFLFGPPNVEKMKARRDVKGLIKALSYQKNSGVRKAAARALGEIGDARAVEPLIAALKDELSWVREAAAEALGKIGDARAIEPLIAALKDQDRDVRKAAVTALGQIGAPAVEPLIAALKDKSENVREAAAEALGKIGDARAVDQLIHALDDKYDSVARAAARALKRIGEPRANVSADAWERSRGTKAKEKTEAERLRSLVDNYLRATDSIVINDWYKPGEMLLAEGDGIIPFIAEKIRSLVKSGDYYQLQKSTLLLGRLGSIGSPAAVEAIWEFVSMPSHSRRYNAVTRRAAISEIVGMALAGNKNAQERISEIAARYLEMVPDNEELSEAVQNAMGESLLEQYTPCDAVQFVDSHHPNQKQDTDDDATTDQGRPLHLPTLKVEEKSIRSIRFGIGGAGCALDWAFANYCYRTSDGGRTWQKVYPGGHVSGVFFLDSDTGWACITDHSRKFIVKTTDGGATWAKGKSPNEYFNSIFFTDKNHGWAVGAGGTVYATTDGGATWVAQHSNVNTPLWGVHFVDTETGFAVGEEGVIIYTTNGGRQWKLSESGTMAWFQAVFFVDRYYGWAVGKSVCATKDGGATWVKLPMPQESTLTSVYFSNRRDGWVAGKKLFRTEDGGLTWKE